jgi:hypothetical protein
MRKRNPIEMMLDKCIAADQKRYREEIEQAKLKITSGQPNNLRATPEQQYLDTRSK